MERLRGSRALPPARGVARRNNHPTPSCYTVAFECLSHPPKITSSNTEPLNRSVSGCPSSLSGLCLHSSPKKKISSNTKPLHCSVCGCPCSSSGLSLVSVPKSPQKREPHQTPSRYTVASLAVLLHSVCLQHQKQKKPGIKVTLEIPQGRTCWVLD